VFASLSQQKCDNDSQEKFDRRLRARERARKRALRRERRSSRLDDARTTRAAAHRARHDDSRTSAENKGTPRIGKRPSRFDCVGRRRFASIDNDLR
jgi:hypothetical protein